MRLNDAAELLVFQVDEPSLETNSDVVFYFFIFFTKQSITLTMGKLAFAVSLCFIEKQKRY